MRKLIAITVLALFLGGCSSVMGGAARSVVVPIIDKDLQRTIELAEKYGQPAVAQCAKYLRGATEGRGGLLGEETEGLMSLALKLWLLKQSGVRDEEAFKKECGPFAAGLMLEVGKSMRR